MSTYIPSAADLNAIQTALDEANACTDWVTALDVMCSYYKHKSSPRWLKSIWINQVDLLFSCTQVGNKDTFFTKEFDRRKILGLNYLIFGMDKELFVNSKDDLRKLYALSIDPFESLKYKMQVLADSLRRTLGDDTEYSSSSINKDNDDDDDDDKNDDYLSSERIEAVTNVLKKYQSITNVTSIAKEVLTTIRFFKSLKKTPSNNVHGAESNVFVSEDEKEQQVDSCENPALLAMANDSHSRKRDREVIFDSESEMTTSQSEELDSKDAIHCHIEQAVDKAKWYMNSSEERQVYALIALAKLTVNSENNALIMHADGFTVVKEVLQREGTVSALITEQVFQIVGNLAISSDNSTKIGQKKGIQILARAMGYHMKSLAVCKEFCTAIFHLAINNAYNQKTITTLQVIPLLFDVMKRHPQSATVCEMACAALAILAARKESNAQVAEGTTRLLNVLIDHKRSVAICKQVIRTLSYLSTAHQGRVRIVQAHGIEILVDVLQRLKQSVAVCEEVFVVLTRLARDHELTKVTMAGTHRIILDILQCHPESAQVSVAGCRGLVHLMQDTDQVRLIQRSEMTAFVNILQRLQNNHIESSKVCESICAIIAHLSRIDTHRLLICELGVFKTIESCMTKHDLVAAVQIAGDQALHILNGACIADLPPA